MKKCTAAEHARRTKRYDLPKAQHNPVGENTEKKP